MVGPAHSTLSGVDLHEDKRVKAPVNAASTAQVSLTAPGTTLDGVTLASGNRILLKNQTAPAENGIYVWSAASAALTRATDADASADFTLGFLVFVAAGTVNGTSLWMFSQTATFTLGTTAATFTSPQGVQGAQGATGASGASGPSGPPGPPGSIAVSGAPPYICLQDQKAAPSDGGTATAGSWLTRTLNTLTVNTLGLASLASNQLTLPAGTYSCRISVPAAECTTSVARLQNISSGVPLLRGTVVYSSSTGSAVTSLIAGNFSLDSQSAVSVQHWVATTRATFGLGIGSASGGTLDGGIDIYTVAEFWLIGPPPPFFGSTLLTATPSFDRTYRRRQSAWNAM